MLRNTTLNMCLDCLLGAAEQNYNNNYKDTIEVPKELIVAKH